MPPKKVLKIRGGGKWRAGRAGRQGWPVGEPRVILRPLRAETADKNHYRFTTPSPTSGLFNKPEFSDIKLKVGDQTYYAHRLILCSASDVFAKMLGTDWIESKKRELVLQEEDECVKVFHRFLFFFYSGSVIISDSYVIPLYMLADKYNVTQLYNECVKQIENGLKIYTYVTRQDEDAPRVGGGTGAGEPAGGGGGADTADEAGPSRLGEALNPAVYSSADSSCSDSSDSDSSDGEPEADAFGRILNAAAALAPGAVAPTSTVLPGGRRIIKEVVGSETFPLVLVMKMLTFSQNERITNAALYNLEARLCSQIRHDNFGVWNDLPRPLLVRMLQDDFFYCNEYFLFSAAKSWLQYRDDRQTEEILTDVLCCIRFPVLSADELYVVEKDEILQGCPDACKLVRDAVRYKLFQNCPRARAEENWSGRQFEQRKVKDDH